jgi:hypothetical protein
MDLMDDQDLIGWCPVSYHLADVARQFPGQLRMNRRVAADIALLEKFKRDRASAPTFPPPQT